MKMALEKKSKLDKFQQYVLESDNEDDEATARSCWKRRKTISQSTFVISIK